MASAASSAMAFQHDRYQAHRKLFTFPAKFYFYDSTGNTVAFFEQKAFKLKEDIRLYNGPEKTQELLQIRARKILDFSSAYDVVDPASQQKIGGLKRKGWKSILKDEWIIMDQLDNEVGKIQEDSALLATIRRFLTNLVPQSYNFVVGDQVVGTAKQPFNPFVLKLNVDLANDVGRKLDRRMAAAAAVLLLAIEGRQQ